MDAETASRAFEPFFTTKPVGEGTGLGLAVVHGTVQALGGRIKLRTAPGRGSVFAITLPCIGRAGAGCAASTDTFPAGQGRAVLLVEPDDAAAEAVGVMLRAAGYRVTRHAPPPRRCAAFSAQRRAELLVSALHLPALPGLELARAMRLLAPGLGVVLLADAPASRRRSGRREAWVHRSSASRCCAGNWLPHSAPCSAGRGARPRDCGLSERQCFIAGNQVTARAPWATSE